MRIVRRMLPGWPGRRCVDFVVAFVRKSLRTWKLRRRDVALRSRGGYFRMLRAHLEPLEPRLALANGFINTNGTSVAGYFNGGGIIHSFTVTAVSPDTNHDGIVNTNTLTLSGAVDGPGAGQFSDTHSGIRIEAVVAGTSTVIGSDTFSGSSDRATFSGMTVSLPTGNGSRNVDLRISRTGFGSVTILRTSDNTNLRGLFTVDTVVPTVTINKTSGQSDPTNTAPINFLVDFSEVVSGFTESDVTVTSTGPGTLTKTVTVVSSTAATYNVAVSGMTGNGTVTASIAAGRASDAAGNSNTASTSTDNAVVYDATRPTVTISKMTGQSDPTAGSPVNFSVVFNEAVTGFAANDVILTGSTAPGTLSATISPSSGNGTNFTVAVSGMTGSGTVQASVRANAASDAATNTGPSSQTSAASVTYDVTKPTVTINRADSQPDPTANSPINFTVVFSEVVSGFSSSDVALSGTAPGTLSAVINGTGPTYNVAVSGMTGNGTVIASIPLNVVTDAAGNGNEASTSTDNSVAVDMTGLMADIIDVAPDPRTTAVDQITIMFSVAVMGFDLADLRLSRNGGNNLLTGDQTLTTSDSVTWTLGNLAELTGTPGNYRLTIVAAESGIRDLPGNLLTVDVTDAWLYASPPTITSIDNQTTNEDVAMTSTTFSLSDAETEAASLLVFGSSSDQALIPDANIVFSGAGANRSVVITPASQRSGTATITIRVEDENQEVALETFELTVMPVNDPPAFSIANVPGPAANDDDGLSIVEFYATSISAGPPDEVSQKVSFHLESSDPDLFDVAPAVDANGQLTFTPRRNAHGTANITIRLSDDGGTANGGEDTSAPQAFQIVIKKPLPRHNTLRSLDVQPDGIVVAGDALDVINYLNAFGAGELSEDEAAGPPYYDTTGDNVVAADDALDVINFINAFGGGLPAPEGEGQMPTAGEAADSFEAPDRTAENLAAMIDFLGREISGEQARRRRRG